MIIVLHRLTSDAKVLNSNAADIVLIISGLAISLFNIYGLLLTSIGIGSFVARNTSENKKKWLIASALALLVLSNSHVLAAAFFLGAVKATYLPSHKIQGKASATWSGL